MIQRLRLDVGSGAFVELKPLTRREFDDGTAETSLNMWRLKMTSLSKVLLATALAVSCAAPALADAAIQTLAERNVYLFKNGTMVSVPTTEATHAMAMKEFKPLKNGTMVYVSGGKFYIGEDRKMTDGKMLHSMIFGKDLSAGGW
jgi:hypothetical protein